jgi:hypothetical protein
MICFGKFAWSIKVEIFVVVVLTLDLYVIGLFPWLLFSVQLKVSGNLSDR